MNDDAAEGGERSVVGRGLVDDGHRGGKTAILGVDLQLESDLHHVERGDAKSGDEAGSCAGNDDLCFGALDVSVL